MYKLITLLVLGLVVAGTVGWVSCIVKFAKTDFQAPYKAEIIYGAGIVTGAGSIIGYINIDD